MVACWGSDNMSRRLLNRRGTISKSVAPSGLTVASPEGPFVVYDGNYVADTDPAFFVRTADPVTLQKIQIQRYTGWGIGSMQYFPPADPTPERTLVEDCIAKDISASPPGIRDGTGEAGFWFGNPTTARRIYAENVSWMGIWTGNLCQGTALDPCIFEDVKVKQPNTGSAGIGIYVEHVTKYAIFRRFDIETTNGNGINVEWWYGGEGSSNLVFEDGRVYCPPSGIEWNAYMKAGIFVDAGNYGCTFRRITFWGPGNALGLPNNLASPVPHVVEDCVFQNGGYQVQYHDNAIG